MPGTRESCSLSRPRYLRTRQAYCWYTHDWHLYLFAPWTGSRDYNLGFTIKHRRNDKLWRHITARTQVHPSSDGETGVFHSELVTHLSTEWGGGRIPRTKRYVRFKVRL